MADRNRGKSTSERRIYTYASALIPHGVYDLAPTHANGRNIRMTQLIKVIVQARRSSNYHRRQACQDIDSTTEIRNLLPERRATDSSQFKWMSEAILDVLDNGISRITQMIPLSLLLLLRLYLLFLKPLPFGAFFLVYCEVDGLASGVSDFPRMRKYTKSGLLNVLLSVASRYRLTFSRL